MVSPPRGLRRPPGPRAGRPARPARRLPRLSQLLSRRPDRAAGGLPPRPPRAARAGRRPSCAPAGCRSGPWYVLADELVPSGESLVRNLLARARRRRAARRTGRRALLARRVRSSRRVARPRARVRHPVRRALARARRRARARMAISTAGAPPMAARSCSTTCRPTATRRARAWWTIPAGLREAWAALRPVLTGRAPRRRTWRYRSARTITPRPPPSAECATCSPRLEPDADGPGLAASTSISPPRPLRPTGVPASCGASCAGRYGYTWTLQGVHATRAPLKRRHAEAELLLERIGRAAGGAGRRTGRGDRRALLDDAWRALVRSQFHDSIGGCTSDAVARRVAVRLDDAGRRRGRSRARASTRSPATSPTAPASSRSDTAPRLVLWNPARPAARGRRSSCRSHVVPPRRARRSAGRPSAAPGDGRAAGLAGRP